jgi:hypothetical protein
MVKPVKKTYHQTKTDLVEKAMKRVITRRQTSEYANQAGFSQVGNGVQKLLHDAIIADVLGVVVRQSIVLADEDGERSLRVKRAVQAIERTRTIPPGHYQ